MEIATFADASQWEAWLATYGTERREIWMRIARADSGHTTVTADQALDVCLCYGWIDSQRRSDEGGYFLQRYHPAAQVALGQRSTPPRWRHCSWPGGCSRQGWQKLLPQRRPGGGQPTSAEYVQAHMAVTR